MNIFFCPIHYLIFLLAVWSLLCIFLMVVSHDCVQVEQYFYTRLLGLDTVPGSWAAVRGELAACLAVLWVWAYFCTWKRRRTTQLSRQPSWQRTFAKFHSA